MLFLTKKILPKAAVKKGVLIICSKFTGEHPCWSAISVKLQSNFNEITLQHGCSPVNLLHIFKAFFSKNTFGGLLVPVVLSGLCCIFTKTIFLLLIFYFKFYKIFRNSFLGEHLWTDASAPYWRHSCRLL